MEILKNKTVWLSGVSGLILGWTIAYAVLTSNKNSKFDEIFQSGQELGYSDAIEDVRNSKIVVADDFILIPIMKNGDPDSTITVTLKNPTFFIKEVEE